MIDPKALLWLHHEEVTHRDAGAPTQILLRRAISSFYYALFHQLCREIADLHVGVTAKGDPRYSLIYRCLEHARAKDVCRKIAADKGASQGAIDIANAFLSLQDARHRADYDPLAKFRIADVRGYFLDAESAIEALDSGFPDKHLMLTRLMVRERS